MATILAIESSSLAASVAVVADGEVVFESLAVSGLFHSQTLMVMLKNSIDHSKFDLTAVDYLAVSIGPGSFTGLRIGVAAAQGLSAGLGVCCLGVSTLRSLAGNFANLPVYVCSVIDARNDFVYFGLFDMAQKEVFRQIMADDVMLINDLLTKLEGLKLQKTIILVGDGAVKCYDRFKKRLHNVVLASGINVNARAASVGLCAQADLNSNVINTDFKLNYLRPSQAQRLLNEKERHNFNE